MSVQNINITPRIFQLNSRINQKEAFNSLPNLYSQANLPVPYAIEREVYFHQAKEVLNGRAFRIQPDAINDNLRQLAGAFIQSVSHTFECLNRGPISKSNLKKLLEDLRPKHWRFVDQFSKVYYEVYPAFRAKNEFPNSVTLFKQVVQNSPRLTQLSNESSPAFFTITPALVIINILKGNQIPELYLNQSIEIGQIKDEYERLSDIQKNNLEEKFFDNQIPLDIDSLNIFRKIGACIHIQDKDLKAVLQATLTA